MSFPQPSGCCSRGVPETAAGPVKAALQASAIPRIVEAGTPTDSLVANVVVAKYADHVRLYRQAKIFARQNVQLDRSALADWVARAAR